MSTAYRPNWRAPYLIVQGVDNALTFDVLSAAGAQQTASAGTIGIYRGTSKTEVIADGTAATGLGPPATYTLLAAATSSLTLDPRERWDVRWTLTLGGTAYKFRRPAYLTEFDLWPQIVQQDLADEDPTVSSFVYSGGVLANLQTVIADAWDYLLWDYYRREIPVHMVTDGGSLVWPHLALSLAKAFRMARRSEDDPYGEKAAHWMMVYEDAIKAPLPIDLDASGAADAQQAEAAGKSWPVHPERPRAW